MLYTNYQFYIDEFVKLGRTMMSRTDDEETRAYRSEYSSFVEPGDVITYNANLGEQFEDEGTAPARLPQMPAYHLKRADGSGITMVNIGVGPSNAKTITDHIAVLRPHAWIMLGHCAGLRNTQRLGDYVLAHGYVREDHVLDADLPLWVPIPALAEVQVALEKRGRAGDATGRRRIEARDAHGNGGERRQPQLGVARSSRAGAAAVAKPRDCARHGKRDDRRERLPLPRALRHACYAYRTSRCMAN